MNIKNKMESIEKIQELNLNKFPEQLFRENDEKNVLQFLKKYPAKYYAIRDKSKVGGIFKLKVESDKVLEEIKDYSLYTINVSSANYIENQLLVGEIQILSNNDVYLTVTTDPKASVRDAITNPMFNIKSNIFDNELDSVPYFDEVYQYIINNELKDVIVEFALFDKNVGIKNERTIVYELRTDY